MTSWPRFPLVVVLALSASVAAGCAKRSAEHRSAPGAAIQSPPSPLAQGPAPTAGAGQHGPIVRTAALEIRAELWVEVVSPSRATEAARALAALASAKDGWVESTSMGESGPSRTVVRVPPAAIDAVRSLASTFRAGDTPMRETMTTKDVTDVLTDVEARMNGGRKEEARLLALLEQRTGTLADVLAVERALSDVRTRIEQLEAQQRVANGRVDFATIEVTFSPRGEEPVVSLVGQVRSAAREGVALLRETLVGFALVALRMGPTLLLLAALAYGTYRGIRGIRRRRLAT